MEDNRMERRSLKDIVEVHISKDKMLAEIVLKEEGDSAGISVEVLKKVLGEHGVRYGILDYNLEKIAANPQSYVKALVEVARGIPPIDGEDGSIEYLLSYVEKRKPVAMEESDGSVDFHNIKNVENIVKGQLLARKYPSTEGTDGVDVSGNKVPARKGKDAPWKLGKNVVLDNDKEAAYAAIDGQFCITEKEKINVFPIFEVNGDVDFGIGNIDFVGTVVVRGNILAGFKVKASGDLRVYGGIEGAEVDVNGSVEVTSGIAAQNKGFVRAGVDVKASFIQNAQVLAGQDVKVSQSIMHSKVSAGRELLCHEKKGLIVGGTVQAGEKVLARIIGNMMYTPTSVEVGAKPELREELAAIENRLKEVQENAAKTKQAIKLFEQMSVAQRELPSEKKLMLIKLSNTQLTLQQELQELGQKKEQIIHELEECKSARIEVLTQIFTGTKLVIGNYVRYIKDNYTRTYFVLEEGDIISHPLR